MLEIKDPKLSLWLLERPGWLLAMVDWRTARCTTTIPTLLLLP